VVLLFRGKEGVDPRPKRGSQGGLYSAPVSDHKNLGKYPGSITGAGLVGQMT